VLRVLPQPLLPNGEGESKYPSPVLELTKGGREIWVKIYYLKEKE
jgi:hypothetical protein